MPRRSASLTVCLLLFLSMMAPAATLEQLSDARLIDESTEIVRGTVVYCNFTYRQPVIWTVCEVNVAETFKGQPALKVQVAIPGGTSGGYRQSFEGTPTLTRNSEYLFFLWQGKSGLKQIMGLSQGLLNVAKDTNGNLIGVRGKTSEQMVNAAGQPVADTGINMPLSDLRARINGRRAIGARH